MEQTTELSSKSTLCIICLEELNDDIMKMCDTCNINCHIECLYSWYVKNNVELCPICLKHTDNNTSVYNETFQSNNNRIETIENDLENIHEIFDNEKDIRMSCILIVCILVIITLLFIRS